MGVTTFPCPKCGQAQSETHENGAAVKVRLCAACAESFTKERDEILGKQAAKKDKQAALERLALNYGAPEQDAKGFAQACLAAES